MSSVETGQMSSVETRKMSQQQTSVLSQQQASVLEALLIPASPAVLEVLLILQRPLPSHAAKDPQCLRTSLRLAEDTDSS